MGAAQKDAVFSLYTLEDGEEIKGRYILKVPYSGLVPLLLRHSLTSQALRGGREIGRLRQYLSAWSITEYNGYRWT